MRAVRFPNQMHSPDIDKQFIILLEKSTHGRLLRKRVGMSARQAAVFRYRHSQGGISSDLKNLWLAKAGLLSIVKYSDADLLSLLNFYDHLSQAGKELGHDYAIGKWLAMREHQSAR